MAILLFYRCGNLLLKQTKDFDCQVFILNTYAFAVPFFASPYRYKNRYKMDFLTIKQYLISISPLTEKEAV